MFGITGALLAIQYRLAGSFKAFTADRSVRSTAFQIGLWTALGIYAIPMSQAGHFGGLITGALMTLIISLRQQRRAAWVAFAVAFAAFTIAAVRPWMLFRAQAVDFAAVKLGRLGQPTENAELVEAQAPIACARGVQRACVIQIIGQLDLDHPEVCRAQYNVLVPACRAGDQDAVRRARRAHARGLRNGSRRRRRARAPQERVQARQRVGVRVEPGRDTDAVSVSPSSGRSTQN